MPLVANISDLPTQEFQDLVNKDVRGELDPETSRQLREPENLNNWYDSLLKLKRTVEAQLTSNQADLAAKQADLLGRGNGGTQEWLATRAAAERWRQGAIRFKNGVEERLAEAKQLRHRTNETTYVASLVRERDRALLEAARLRTAILEHKSTVLSDNDDDSTDDKLWAVLGTEVV